MRKLRLELDALTVETFAPAEGAGARGTVHGHVSLYWEDCQPSETCGDAGWPCGPSEQSCNGTCYEHSCGTCYEDSCQPGWCASGGCTTAGCGGSDPAITCNGVICVEDTGG